MRWTSRAVAGLIARSLALAVPGARPAPREPPRPAGWPWWSAPTPPRPGASRCASPTGTRARSPRCCASWAASPARTCTCSSTRQPAAVLSALDGALRDAARSDGETLVLFYYSGHADTASLYPGGRAARRWPSSRAARGRPRPDAHRHHRRLPRRRLDRHQGPVASRRPSTSSWPLDLASRGLGAHRLQLRPRGRPRVGRLRGSFFTHHWNAALRGAADRNGDDRVTLAEAFEYARALTIRDTALHTDNPQHPSFRFNLLGRGDLPLSELAPGSSVIELQQSRGPLQVIHLGTGLLVVELPRGARRVRVSLAPGRYLVRRRTGDAVQAREVRLGAGRRVQVTESSLLRIAGNRFAVQGGGRGDRRAGGSHPAGDDAARSGRSAIGVAAVVLVGPAQVRRLLRPQRRGRVRLDVQDTTTPRGRSRGPISCVTGATWPRAWAWASPPVELRRRRAVGDHRRDAVVAGGAAAQPDPRLQPVRGRAVHLRPRHRARSSSRPASTTRSRCGPSSDCRPGCACSCSTPSSATSSMCCRARSPSTGSTAAATSSDPTPGPHIELGFRVTGDNF